MKKLSELARLILIKTICKGVYTFETGREKDCTFGEDEYNAAKELRRKGLIDLSVKYFELARGGIKVVHCKKCKKLLKEGKFIRR